MRHFGVVCALVVAIGSLVGAAQARDPRAERVRVNAADVALAKRITVGPNDLARGWRRVRAPAAESASCNAFHPDTSAFTITGRATSAFTSGTLESVQSA